MMHRLYCFILLFALAGCSPGASVDALPDAKDVAQEFFNQFKERQFDSIYELYSDDFWTAMPKETWGKILPNVHEELGTIESCELNQWNQSTHASTSGSGNFVRLSYACKHTKYESVISFTIFKPLEGGKSVILAQNFNSLGLLLE